MTQEERPRRAWPSGGVDKILDTIQGLRYPAGVVPFSVAIPEPARGVEARAAQIVMSSGMADTLRQSLLVVLGAFALIQGVVVLMLLLAVRRYVLPQRPGPAVGRWIPRLSFTTPEGESIEVGGQGRVSALVFVGPTCTACQAMPPSLLELVACNEGMAVTFFGAGDAARNREFAARIAAPVPYVVLPSPEVRVREFGVRRVPFLLILDGTGVVTASGYVPSREKIEKVLESAGIEMRALHGVR